MWLKICVKQLSLKIFLSKNVILLSKNDFVQNDVFCPKMDFFDKPLYVFLIRCPIVDLAIDLAIDFFAAILFPLLSTIGIPAHEMIIISKTRFENIN